MTRTYRLKRDTLPPVPDNLGIDTDLNEEQRRVVLAGNGTKLVIAGAGTGKTRALTTRVAYLVQQGVPIESILLLTFTNRAAREMTSRVEQLLGMPMNGMSSGTFHSLGRRFVTEFSATLGFPEHCQVIDSEDAETLLRQCMDVVPQAARRARMFPRPNTILNWLSQSINTGSSFEDVVLESGGRFADALPHLYELLVAYQQAKVERGLVDFDDLLVYWQRLLIDHPNIAHNLSARYLHVLVDEYQDTNLVQADIVDRMSAVHGNLMVVGDDHQSIYAFRGAVHENILHFGQRHPACETFYLTQNYRSSPEILRLANLSIRHNQRQFKKELHSTSMRGNLPALVYCRSKEEEAAFVAQRILEAHDEGVDFKQIAVLYRAHSHAAQLELELTKRGIPYILRSGKRLFERAHIKDALSFLRMVVNPRDDLAAMRTLKLCEGIGDKHASTLSAMFMAYETMTEALDAFQVQTAIPTRAKASFELFEKVVRAIDAPAIRSDVSKALEIIVDEFYGDIVKTTYDLPKNRLLDLDSIIELASTFDDYAEFLTASTIDRELTAADTLERADSESAVVLSTAHQAKGLEFNTVFILSMNEEKFPHGAAMYNFDELEEERRLFYVAVTRAQRELYLCVPLMGPMGRGAYGPLRMSPFILEIANHEPPAFESWRLE